MVFTLEKTKKKSLLYSSTAPAPSFSGTYKAAPVAVPVAKPAAPVAQPVKSGFTMAPPKPKPSLLNTGAPAPNLTTNKVQMVPKGLDVTKPVQKYVAPPELVKQAVYPKPEVQKPLEFSVLKKYIPQLVTAANTARATIANPATAILTLPTVKKKTNEFLQSTLRSYAAFGSQVLGDGAVEINDPLSKRLFGTDKTFTLGEQQPFLDPNSKFAIPLAAAFVLSDAIPGSKQLKQVVTQRGVKAVMHVDDIALVDDILRRSPKTLADGDRVILQSIFEAMGMQLPKTKGGTLDFVKTIWRNSDKLNEAYLTAQSIATPATRASLDNAAAIATKNAADYKALKPQKSFVSMLRDEVGKFTKPLYKAYKKSPLGDERGFVKNPFAKGDDLATTLYRGQESNSTRTPGMTPGYTGTAFSRLKNQAQKYGDRMIEQTISENRILKPNDIPQDLLSKLRKEFDNLPIDDADSAPIEKLISKVMNLAKSRDKDAADIASFFPRMAEEAEIRVLDTAQFLNKAKGDITKNPEAGFINFKAIGESLGLGKAQEAGDLPKAARQGESYVSDVSRPTTSSLPARGLSGPDIPPNTGPLKAATPDTSASLSSSPQSVGGTFAKVKTSILEYVQNTEERIRQLQKRPDLKIDDTTDIYQKMTLMPGRISAMVEKGFDKARGIADDIVDLSGKGKTAVKTTRDEVNTYLQALHAPERNKALRDGAAGMLTDDALKITAAARPEVKAIAQKALDLNRETLKMLHDAGVVSDDLVKTLTTKYQNHVPLQRVMDEADDIGDILSGAGLDVKSTGIKTAKGSAREVKDILANIMTNYEQAVIRAQKNVVDNTTLAFVRKNQAALGDLFQIKHPKVIGRRIDDFAEFQSAEGSLIYDMSNATNPQVLSFFEKGKRTEIHIKDPMLAIAIRGVGREKLGGIMRGVQAITRFYSSLATRFNPEFALPNKIRDLQETMSFLASQGDVGFKGAAKAALKDPGSIKDVTNWMRGADTPGTRLYQEMIEMGGTTGGMGLSTRKQIEINIDKMFNVARSNPRKAASRLIEYVDNFNTVFEDSTRLSVYKSALSQGLSKERAAFLAKEASINFNRMGKGGPMINALYMFSNASIQGSTKMMRAMANPKVAASVVTVVGASVATTNEWNDTVDPDWREKIPKWDRQNGLNIVLPMPGTEDDSRGLVRSKGGIRYFVIPVGWGLKPILVMANGAHDAYAQPQDFNAEQLTKDVLTAFLNAYNPIGGTSITSALTPTVLDLAADIRANEKWSGAPIRPAAIPGQNTPRDIQYFDSLEETTQGRLTIEATKKLQEATGISLSPADVNYAVDNIVGGAGRAVKKLFNTTAGFFSDEPVPMDEYPFISRFYHQMDEEEAGRDTAKFDELDALKEEQSRESFYRTKEAESTYQSFKEMPKDEANARYKILKETNPLLAEKVKDVADDEKLGLTAIERSIKGLGVANGVRAEYILKELNKLPTAEEKNAKVKEWREKKIISDRVLEQLKILLGK